VEPGAVNDSLSGQKMVVEVAHEEATELIRSFR